MKIRLNHFALGARNIYEAAARLRKETGFGFTTGDWIQSTACHMVPLGENVFIEVEGTIDAHAFLKGPQPNYTYDALDTDNEYNGDHFTGMMLGVDTLEELEEIGKRLGGGVTPNWPDPYRHFQRPDGYVRRFQSAPYYEPGSGKSRPRGMPNFYYYPDQPGRPSSQPVVATPHLVTPTGVKWVEYGGTEQQMSEYLNVPKASDILPLRFNGKALGTWAICVGVEGGEDVIIRRPPSAASITDDSKYRAAAQA
jgi:hypothetical protein